MGHTKEKQNHESVEFTVILSKSGEYKVFVTNQSEKAKIDMEVPDAWKEKFSIILLDEPVGEHKVDFQMLGSELHLDIYTFKKGKPKMYMIAEDGEIKKVS